LLIINILFVLRLNPIRPTDANLKGLLAPTDPLKLLIDVLLTISQAVNTSS